MGMPIRGLGKIARDVETLFQLGATGGVDDGQLVARFLIPGEGSEAAFRALVIRHGPMVLSVCRRILDDPAAADDAFQATFMILVKKARGLRNRELLGGWLHGVANRVARKAKSAAARRLVVEQRSYNRPYQQAHDHEQAELRAIIDEEIHRLPEHYRLPLVLCHLEGMRHQEVAHRLGCPVGTVESRLSRAKEQLRTRLVRRGVAPGASVLAAALSSRESAAAMTPLVDQVCRLATAPSSVTTALAAVTATSIPRLMILKSAVAARISLAAFAMIGAGAGVLATAAYSDLGPRIATSVLSAVDAPKPPQGDTPPTSQDTTPSRSPSAIAFPLRGITIDGSLDDWPSNMQKYKIEHRLQGSGDYDPGGGEFDEDPDSYFMVGYDRETSLIYVAVQTHDADVVVSGKSQVSSDATEIYLQGMLSDQNDSSPASVVPGVLDAAIMPVIQYVGLPGEAPAYNNAEMANPALLYGDTSKTKTKMKTRRHENGITTYEWAVQPFDHYPDRPSRLEPGKRLGLDVVLVDRDRDRKLASWYSWAPYQGVFKGFDARTIGELILDGPR
ncbi:RNA polymerase sigma factor [Paludisphaera borealis]|nr:sigma-70 family RNA polymerase sigma factor [Paludisphaera borealis]